MFIAAIPQFPSWSVFSNKDIVVDYYNSSNVLIKKMTLIANLRLSLIGALILFVLFAAQFLIPVPAVRYGFAIFYLAAAIFLLLRDRSRIRAIGTMLWSTGRELLNRK
jgi:hypothetical protein